MKKIIMTVGIILSILCIIVFVLCGKNLSISLMLEDDYEKTHYINDLYDSKELNYRLVLNKNEQKIIGVEDCEYSIKKVEKVIVED